MTIEEFQVIVSKEPALAEPIRRSAVAGGTVAYGTPIEIAAIAVMFPIVVFVIKQIGLPWLYEASRYSELWRLKLHNWIDGQYRKAGFDPDRAEKAANALRSELEQITDANARAPWERLAQLLSKSETEQSVRQLE